MKDTLGAALLTLLAAAPVAPAAEDAKAAVTASIDRHAAAHAAVAEQIWGWAELGFQEERSSALLQEELRQARFAVEAGVAGMPTAFVASYGTGRPVIGLLAEYDALPGINQDASPERQPIAGKSAGHACGHHLLGTGAVAAAVAVGEWLAASGSPGTIRVYGTPAEEGGGGKVYMVRAGLFADVDAVLAWHPDDVNDASPSTSLAIKSAKFRFKGVSAHAAAAPERGRSALDGVEAMDYMVNLMREHVPQETRIHYVITAGGNAPNVIPDFAEVYYYVRHPQAERVQQLFERVVQASVGAALGTGTSVEHEVDSGYLAVLPNEPLARAVFANLQRVGGVVYDDADRAFATKLRESLPADAPALASAATVQPFEAKLGSHSTDVGDVSWVVPTAGLTAATYVPGTAPHSWQAIASGASGIGAKGMRVAAKALAMTAIDLLQDQALVRAAREAHAAAIGPGYVYRSLVGDRQPPLGYREPRR